MLPDHSPWPHPARMPARAHAPQDTHGNAVAGGGGNGKFRLPPHLPCTTTTLLLSWARGGDVKGLVKYLLVNPARQHARHGELSKQALACMAPLIVSHPASVEWIKPFGRMSPAMPAASIFKPLIPLRTVMPNRLHFCRAPCNPSVAALPGVAQACQPTHCLRSATLQAPVHAWRRGRASMSCRVPSLQVITPEAATRMRTRTRTTS